MNKQKRFVLETKKKYGIQKINIDTLIFIIEDLGYEIIEYAESNNLLNSIGLSEYSKVNNGFTYSNGTLRFVFVKEELSVQEKEYIFAHELGHIINNHLDSTSANVSVNEEHEANEFAHYILNTPIFITLSIALYKNKKTILIILLVISIAFVCAFGMNHYNKYNYSGNYYVTEFGEKYHNENCITIKNKNNVHKMTVEEYSSGKYSPCNVCLSDK